MVSMVVVVCTPSWRWVAAGGPDGLQGLNSWLLPPEYNNCHHSREQVMSALELTRTGHLVGLFLAIIQ
jgi:hypothetical protein